MYKVAVRENDESFGETAERSGCDDTSLSCPAAESLNIVAKHAPLDASFLYACVLEAQQSGNRREAIKVLQTIIVTHDSATSTSLHIPSVLR